MNRRTANLQYRTANQQKRLRLTSRPVWSYYTRSSARYEMKHKIQQNGKRDTQSSSPRLVTSVRAPTTEQSRCCTSHELF
ncbi:hypothetical protein DPMN_092017 [Dreissena polymorpha]|uniref:Uncharacterized protein n=1 Tax=Dreissena polymorpha TaxID=45954 RepID=A0A9D4QZR5_DREPO|nr:hypothetical protein DPMN_092017 [Dreissena polymorpha]